MRSSRRQGTHGRGCIRRLYGHRRIAARRIQPGLRDYPSNPAGPRLALRPDQQALHQDEMEARQHLQVGVDRPDKLAWP